MIDRPLLAFDTSGPHVAASLSDGDVAVETLFEPMARGQAEALMPNLQSLLAAHGLSWSDLHAIGVGVGPGNFTGIRISVSAARGLGLALGIPVIGLSAFALRRNPNVPAAKANELVTLAAPRDQVYAQTFRYGIAEGLPMVFDPANPPDHVRRVNLEVTGDHAEAIAKMLGGQADPGPMEDLPRRMARLTDRLCRESSTHPAPTPLYVRPADAAPPKDAAPAILP